MKPLTQLPNAAALELLPPCAATLAALAEAASQDLSLHRLEFLAADPGALLAALHFAPTHSASAFLATLVRETERLADWQAPAAHALYDFSQAVSRVAGAMAAELGENVPEIRAAAVLSPLGSLVRAHAGDTFRSAQEDYLQTRRLTRRWGLPAWIAHLLVRLDLPPEPDAGELPQSRRLAILQAALAFVQLQTDAVWVPVPQSWAMLSEALALSPQTLQRLSELIEHPQPAPLVFSEGAASLLLRSLRAARPARAQENAATVDLVENELEELRDELSRLRRQDRELLQRQKLSALAEFAAGASHEINNPLAVISAQAQHLLKSEESLDRAKGLDRIIAQAKRIHSLLKDLLFYARPPEPQFKPSAVSKLLAQAAEQVTQAAASRDVQVEIAPVSSRLKATLDGDLAVKALVCLLQNAITAAPAQGRVIVTVKVDDKGGLAVSVQDDGPGVDEEMRPHLFDPFFSGRRAGRGPGLGLSKVWRIAQLHGGSIVFEPSPTRFTLTLPPPLKTPKLRLAARHTRRR